MAMVAGVIGKPFTPLLTAPRTGSKLGCRRTRAASAPGAMTEIGIHPANGVRKARVAPAGCANEGIGASITQATIRLLNCHGVEVVVAPEAGRCGSLEHHMGREEGAFAKVRANVDAWTREIPAARGSTRSLSPSRAGTTVKDYGFMLRTDPVHAEKAANVSQVLARDISRISGDALGIVHVAKAGRSDGCGVPLRRARCSMASASIGEPKDLLAACGFVVKDIPEAHLCCGSAGTYNIMQPDIAGRLLDRKIGNIAKTAPDIIAAGNIGCIMQNQRQWCRGLLQHAPALQPLVGVLHFVERNRRGIADHDAAGAGRPAAPARRSRRSSWPRGNR